MGCRSNGSSYPFRKNCQPFEPFELSVQKKLPAIRTARAIRSEKIVSCSNGLGYPFRKNCQPFERIELSVWKKRATVRASAIRSAAHIEQLCQIKKYSPLRSVTNENMCCLQTPQEYYNHGSFSAPKLSFDYR